MSCLFGFWGLVTLSSIALRYNPFRSGPPWEHNHTGVSVHPELYPMPENRSHAQHRRSAAPREFFLPIEVYISNQAAAALRKVYILFMLSQRTAPSVVHETAQPAEEVREEGVFEALVHAGR